MSTNSPDLESSLNYITQNVNNRKLVFQHIAGIQKVMTIIAEKLADSLE